MKNVLAKDIKTADQVKEEALKAYKAYYGTENANSKYENAWLVGCLMSSYERLRKDYIAILQTNN